MYILHTISLTICTYSHPYLIFSFLGIVRSYLGRQYIFPVTGAVLEGLCFKAHALVDPFLHTSIAKTSPLGFEVSCRRMGKSEPSRPGKTPELYTFKRFTRAVRKYTPFGNGPGRKHVPITTSHSSPLIRCRKEPKIHNTPTLRHIQRTSHCTTHLVQ